MSDADPPPARHGAGPVQGLVDRDGRLVEADPPLMALQRMAGGEAGGMIAPPPLAAIVRLAGRIGIEVSRGVIVADEEGDLDLWVRARPDGDDVRLAIGGWTRRPGHVPAAGGQAAQAHDFLRVGADFIWETDAELRVTMLSPPDAGGGGHALGQSLTRMLTPLADGEGGVPLLVALEMRDRFADRIARLGDGSHVRLSGEPLFDGDGRFRGYRGAAVATVDPAIEAGEGAVEADIFRRRLDAALRGPLDRIVASAETIGAQMDGPLRRDYATYAADIATAGRHLLALVGDLVDLQAIERADFAVVSERIDLAEAARRAAGLLGMRAADRDVRIDRPADATSLPARGDSRRVVQILVNVIGNAVRYSAEGGVVSLLCERRGANAAIVTVDRGRGVAAVDQARIFDKFERVDQSEQGGTGLGLYISRRLARAMGGDITVESAPGEGARFVLTLPAA